MIELRNGNLKVTLCEPWTFYKGQRFDHGGVFHSIYKGDYCYAGQWFKKYDPYNHDAVCGCSEEFVFADLPDIKPGETFVKPGVGLLVRPDEEPYAFVRPYEVADKGQWEYHTEGSAKAVFRHSLDGWYDYTKTIELICDCSFRISHRLEWKNPTPFNGWCYCHNFYTFDGKQVGPDRLIDFPFRPEGDWRSQYHCVALNDNGIRFSDSVEKPSVYMGNLHPVDRDGIGSYELKVSDCAHQVRINCELEKIVFWSNPDVACLEPYRPVNVKQGEVAEWSAEYSFR